MTSSLVERPSFSWCFLGFRRASIGPPSPFTSISRAHFAHSDLHHILADWCAPNYVAVRYKGGGADMAANGGNHRCALILSPLRVGETRGGGGVGAITWTGGCR